MTLKTADDVEISNEFLALSEVYKVLCRHNTQLFYYLSPIFVVTCW